MPCQSRQTSPTESATGSRSATEEPTSEYFWPNLKAHMQPLLNGPGGPKALGLQAACNICLEALHVPGFSDPSHPAAEACSFTPCGHIFCKPCLRRAIRRQERLREEEDGPDMPKSCPACRMALSCERCGVLPTMCHPIVKQVGDGSDGGDGSAITDMLTIPEGCEFKRECLRCLARKTWAAYVDEQDPYAVWSMTVSPATTAFVRLATALLDRQEDAPELPGTRNAVASFSDEKKLEFQYAREVRETYIQFEIGMMRGVGGNPWFHGSPSQ
ncbi:hypothetical protein EDB81DRAFT_151848 [Dactylonectria macrodidyma]|uniref:RING-type domain-containing protein n=1 Tax=Dactylonectria macrodidyma TaxID=307937 RepID=A0A9P9FMH6_9HYPO|nr:hypothetical protein EDB81DRAFT_151848 [Dactylonectria macrodidyma]